MQRTVDLLQWLNDHGGDVHKDLVPQCEDDTGLSIFASRPIPTEQILVSCPFRLAITSQLAEQAILTLTGASAADLTWPVGSSQGGRKWNDRMLIGAYIALHWLLADITIAALPTVLQHATYIASLPSPAELLTPLHYTDGELALLQGTNLYGGVLDRRREWKEEYEVVKAVLQNDNYTWDQYLTSSTYLSSRAFPSKLLHIPASGSVATNAVQTSIEEESHPVLLPGIDLFNHARAQPITWLSSRTPSPSGPIETMSLVSARQQPAGEQVFNNYGPKPNEELLLGYGFVIDENPDDVVALKIGTSSLSSEASDKLRKAKLDPSKRFLLRRDGKLDPELLAVLRIIIAPDYDDDADIDSEDEHAAHEQEQEGIQLELDVLGAIGQMLDDKLVKIETEVEEGADIRPAVREMCRVYRKGQQDILKAAIEAVSDRIQKLEGLMDQGMGGCSCCS